MKAYEKPKLYAESFALVEHISTNCTPSVTSSATFHSLEEPCGIDVTGDGGILFVSDGYCWFHQDPSASGPNPSLEPGICYQGTFFDNAQAFSS